MSQTRNMVLAAIAAVILPGCASITRHGDAYLYDQPNIIFVYRDPLKFPLVPLGERGVHTFRVLDLPQEIYPHEFLLEIPELEDSRYDHDQPWRHAVFRASLQTLEGKTFFSKTYDYTRDWNGGSEPGSDDDTRKIWLPFTNYHHEMSSSLPRHRSYILRIEILQPSLRATDRLEVAADTLLPRAQHLMNDPWY